MRRFSGATGCTGRSSPGTYGKPLRTGRSNTRLIPINGVFRYAVWEVGKRRLFVAAAREDRECPMELVLGAAPGRVA